MLGSQWFASNELRAYPFDIQGPLLSDDDKQLPEGLLVDASISFDKSFGDRLQCRAISRTSTGASFVFGTMSNPAIAICTLTLPAAIEDFENGKAIPIEPVLSGVSGYIVPGKPLWMLEPGNLFFSGDRSLYITPRAAFPIRIQKEQSFSVLNSSSALRGLVLLDGIGDMSIRIEPRVLGGKQKTAVVFRLSDVANAGSVLSQYAGSKQQRPESRTCGDPSPVETINQVAADCCGRIYIELRGCAQPVPIVNHCGVVLDCPQTPDEFCEAKKTYEDRVSEGNDTCIESGQPDVVTPPTNPPVPPTWYT